MEVVRKEVSMRKLNGKNKFFVTLFILIILPIIVVLFLAVKSAKNDGNLAYNVTNNTAIFADDTNLIDTSDGGKINVKWDGEYYYLSSNNRSYKLGKNPVVYDRDSETLNLMGTKYQVLSNGSVNKILEMVSINDYNSPYFYKLDDRIYLIVAKEIYNIDKSIYANNYLIVNIDKQGNASVYNDSINIKTVNPMSLVFSNYTFDIANEKLIIANTSIDLKSIIGSTNEYVFKEKEEEKPYYDGVELLDSYNDLVNDFNKYTDNTNMIISANNQIVNNNTAVVNNLTDSVTNIAREVLSKTIITKRVSLRGCISYSSYIDVTYSVTDPENKYQAVYLLVTGKIDGSVKTEKILLDKYQTTTRINNLSPRSEYTISLGYIEIVKNDDEKSLSDNIEDIVNVRTTKVDYKLEIEKIASGNVYFNFKMNDNYAFSSGRVSLYVDNEKVDEVNINPDQIISEKGFSSKLKLISGRIYELRLEETVYDNESVDFHISKKFSLSS